MTSLERDFAGSNSEARTFATKSRTTSRGTVTAFAEPRFCSRKREGRNLRPRQARTRLYFWPKIGWGAVSPNRRRALQASVVVEDSSRAAIGADEAIHADDIGLDLFEQLPLREASRKIELTLEGEHPKEIVNAALVTCMVDKANPIMTSDSADPTLDDLLVEPFATSTASVIECPTGPRTDPSGTDRCSGIRIRLTESKLPAESDVNVPALLPCRLRRHRAAKLASQSSDLGWQSHPMTTLARSHVLDFEVCAGHAELGRRLGNIIEQTCAEAWSGLLEAWNEFATEMLHHLDYEERSIFIDYEKENTQQAIIVCGLLVDHAAIRGRLEAVTRGIRSCTVSLVDFEHLIDLLRNHARREASTVYPWLSARYGKRHYTSSALA